MFVFPSDPQATLQAKQAIEKISAGKLQANVRLNGDLVGSN
jgi:hypothetical protein